MVIHQQRGIQFDPQVVDAFFAGIERIIAVYHELAETPDADAPAASPPPSGSLPERAEPGEPALRPIDSGSPGSSVIPTLSDASALAQGGIL